jgi:hypothetical protein
MRCTCMIAFACVAVFASPLAAPLQAAQKDSPAMAAVDPLQYSAMRWRHVDLAGGSPCGNLSDSNAEPTITSIEGYVVRVLIEDTQRKGLVFAGTGHSVYVSFDNVGHWQSLQLNMPASDIRCLFFQQNALLAGTGDHGLWVLDDLAPFREIGSDSAEAPAYLFRPSGAVRVSSPAPAAPPAGAVLYYELKSVPANEITIEIHDSQGNSVRRFTSVAAKTDLPTDGAAKSSILESAQLSKNVGLNCFVWDLRFAPAAPGPAAAFVEPGQYEAILIANGSLMKQAFSVTVDSRMPESQATELKRIDSGIAAGATVIDQMTNLQNAIADRLHTLHSEKSPGKQAAAQRLAHGEESTAALRDLDSRVAKVLAHEIGIHRELFHAKLATQAGILPASVKPACAALKENLATWRSLDSDAVPATSNLIAKSSLAALPTATVMSIMAMPQESPAASSGCVP